MPTTEILAGLDRFYESLQHDRDLVQSSATLAHSPRVLFISCSDARIPVALIAQLDPGSLFVAQVLSGHARCLDGRLSGVP